MIGALLLLTVGTASASMPAYGIHKVTVQTTSGTLSGYISVREGINPGAPDALPKIIKKARLISFWTELKSITYPQPMIVSTGEPQRYIEMASIVKIEKSTSALDGSILQGIGVPQITPALAKLLLTKPLFQCAPTYAEKGIYWLSYNKAIQERALDDFCKRPFGKEPSVEERKAMLQNQDVIEFTFDID